MECQRCLPSRFHRIRQIFWALLPCNHLRQRQRTSAAAEEDSEKEKNEGVKLVEEEIEDVTGKENGYETVEEGEGAQREREWQNLSENEDEKDQTRNTHQRRKNPSSASAKKFADKTRRQSKRLSIIATSKLLETTTPSAPRGKRSHDVMAAGSKSANAKLQGNGSHYAADGSLLRASKRRTTSEFASEKAAEEEEVWLNQGLYLGQGQDLDVRSGLEAKQRNGASLVRIDKPPWKCGPIHNWKKLNHNVLIGEASQLWKREKASMAMCVCEEEKGCDEDCLNRLYLGGMRRRNWDKIRRGCRGHSDQELWAWPPSYEKLCARQIVVEYTGEIITQEESERRMIEDYKDNNNYYLMLFHQNMILDATRGSVARFVNHSCNPNCRMEKWLVDGNLEWLCLLEIMESKLEMSSHMTITSSHWFTGVSQQACHCGAENCRGALGKRADGLQKKPEPPAKGKNGKGKKKGINGKGGIVAEVKKPTRGRPKKVVAHVQKSVIITPKRKYTKRKVVAAPVISPSPAPEDDDSLDSSLDSDDDSDHPTEASPATLKNLRSQKLLGVGAITTKL
ncbi:uncharacterized protein H6S33_009905, partial [Morchella sextelata]|uniref:uncharacterized protein n=1 Tax=Morchella sextelata TaxID=1174677 RepID=UPI001D036094